MTHRSVNRRPLAVAAAGLALSLAIGAAGAHAQDAQKKTTAAAAPGAKATAPQGAAPAAKPTAPQQAAPAAPATVNTPASPAPATAEPQQVHSASVRDMSDKYGGFAPDSQEGNRAFWEKNHK